MLQRNYYYLVAGLPDIIPDQAKTIITVTDLVEELRQHLHPEDIKLVEMLLLTSDNRNLLNILLKQITAFDNRGNFTFDELEEGIKEPETLPPYFGHFIAAFKNNTSLFSELSWEDQLTSLYYDYVRSTKNDFLQRWFEFDLNMRNVLSALSARRIKFPVEKYLIGDNQVNDMLRKSNARDFNLTGEFPLIEKMIQISEQANPLEREKSFDILRWNYIDELNTFNYFSIEVIIGYIIKLCIVERWLKLDKKTGQELFVRFITDLEKSYEFPKVFIV